MPTSTRSLTEVLALVLSMLALSGCAGSPPLTGTWRQPDGSTPLPPEISPGNLNVDATLGMDATTPGSFELNLDLEFMSLADTIDLHGTYVAAGDMLTLEVTGIDPAASGNVTSTNEAGDQCIALGGFGGALVCFPATQTHDYALVADVLTIVIDNSIAGTSGPTTLSLTRVP